MKDFVFVVIVLNVLCEIVEVVFPMGKMKNSIKSFVLLLVLYVIVESVTDLF